MKTKGQIEAEISAAIVRFEQEYLGRGPEETKSHLIDDMVIVRLNGVLTPAEKSLARIDTSTRGRALVKQVRIELLESGRPALETIIHDITGRNVVSLHTDVSMKTGERVLIFTLDGPPGYRLKNGEQGI